MYRGLVYTIRKKRLWDLITSSKDILTFMMFTQTHINTSYTYTDVRPIINILYNAVLSAVWPESYAVSCCVNVIPFKRATDSVALRSFYLDANADMDLQCQHMSEDSFSFDALKILLYPLIIFVDAKCMLKVRLSI